MKCSSFNPRGYCNRGLPIHRALPLFVVWMLGSLTTDATLAQTTPKALLAQSASVSGTGEVVGELVRLPLSLEVLKACQSDLSDLRLFAGEDELPFFVRRAPLSPKALRTRIEPTFGPDVTQVATGGNQPTTVQTETYTVATPPQASKPNGAGVGAGVWHLRLEVPPSKGAFTRRLQLSWQNKAGTRTPIYDGSIFRLSNGRERLSVPLPAPTGSFLALELSGESNEQSLAPLEPRIIYERFAELSADQTDLRVEVQLSAPEGRDEGATYTFELPPGLMPDAFEIETSTGNFERLGRILGTSTTRPAPRLLGSALLRRLTTGQTSTASDLIIPTADANATSFELQIAGGASSPLADLKVIALVRQPELLFEWPASTGNLELLFGGGRIARASFDLERLLHQQTGALSEGKAELVFTLSQTTLPTAHHGAITANPSFDPQPLLQFLQRPGAQLAFDQFRYRTGLELTDAPSGLHRIELGSEILERLRKDLGDLRFADDQGQWPYLLEPSEDWQRPLLVSSSAVKNQPRKNRFTLALGPGPSGAQDNAGVPKPDSALRIQRITLLIDAPFFDRAYTLNAINASGESHTVQTGRIVTSDARSAFYSFYLDASKQRSFDLRFAAQAARQYELIVENGDDAPLPLLEASATGSGWQVLLVAPEGEYHALFGELVADRIKAPSYEITRARTLISSLRGVQRKLNAVSPNGAVGSPGLAGLPWQNLLLWLAIGLSVLGLGWVTLRSVTMS